MLGELEAVGRASIRDAMAIATISGFSDLLEKVPATLSVPGTETGFAVAARPGRCE